MKNSKLKQLVHLNYKHMVAIVLLCSPLWQSCQEKLQATQEERAAEDPKQHTVATPPPAAEDALAHEASLTRVSEPTSQASLLPITRSVVPPGVHRSKVQHVHPCAAPSIAQVPVVVRQRIFDDVVRHNFLNRVAFGKTFWTHYFGDIGKSPALPHDIHAILTSSCPFWEDCMVYKTHLLVLIPARVNGRPFSLNLLGELIQNLQGDGHRTQYRYYDNHIQSQLGTASPDRSYWVLVTRDVLAGSRQMAYSDQKALVACYTDYALPSALEAATAILMYHVRTGERLFSEDPFTYTRSRDQFDWHNNLYTATIGGFSAAGLDLFDSIDYAANPYYGVAACRKC